MAAILRSFHSKNETHWLVSFFFAIAALHANFSLFAYQTLPEPPFAPSMDGQRRIQGASQEQWEQYVIRSAHATLGDDWEREAGPMPSIDLPNAARIVWLNKRIQRWTQSKAFVDRQSRAWVEERCDGAFDKNDAWDFSLHDHWIQRQIASNQPFVRFVQSQLAGDFESNEPDNQLGTATWFRSSKTVPSPAPPSQPRPIAATKREGPTLDTLPDSLRWSHLSLIPWLYTDTTATQRRRLVDLESAMESVLRSEQAEWKRLHNDESVIQAHRSRTGYPAPNPAEITFRLDQMSQVNPADAATDNEIVHPFATPWRYTQPWTAMIQFEVEAIDSSVETDPTLLVRQQSSAGSPSSNQRSCEIEWQQGKIRVRLIHALPQSALELETEPVFLQPGQYSIAVVYEGLPNASALRVWSKGEWVATRIVQESLVRDFASRDSQVLILASSPERSACHLSNLECYRSAMSLTELIGWEQETEWRDWEMCSKEEQQAFRDYYARRIDLQWRYQRESLLFYADNFASALANIGMLPVADPNDLQFIPASFAGWVGMEKNGDWGGIDRQSLAKRCGQDPQMARRLASCEILRQWRMMLASLPSANEDFLTRGELESLVDRWTSSWDRASLIQELVLSDAWLRIAIDSP